MPVNSKRKLLVLACRYDVYRYWLTLNPQWKDKSEYVDNDQALHGCGDHPILTLSGWTNHPHCEQMQLVLDYFEKIWDNKAFYCDACSKFELPEE